MASNDNKTISTFIVAMLAFLAAFAPSSAVVDAKATWKSCGGGGESITIEDVKLIPDPVVAGSVAAFDVAASVASGVAIPDGSISVDIKYTGVEIAHETVKLCDTTACPIPAQGPVSIKYSKTIPAFIPPGAYTIEVRTNQSIKIFLPQLHPRPQSSFSNNLYVRRPSNKSPTRIPLSSVCLLAFSPSLSLSVCLHVDLWLLFRSVACA